jgi:type IV secretion system protein VirB3
MADQPQYELQYDALAVGLTRPPMFMGVSTLLFFGNMAVGMIICLITQSIYGAVLFGILHLLMVSLSAKDPKFCALWSTALRSTPPVLNSLFWGKTNSYEPW